MNDKLYNLYLQLEPVIAELEEERLNSLNFKFSRGIKKLLPYLCIPIIIIFLLIPTGIYSKLSTGINGPILLYVFIFVGICLLSIPESRATEAYYRKFYNKIILPLMQSWIPTIKIYSELDCFQLKSQVKDNLIIENINNIDKTISWNINNYEIISSNLTSIIETSDSTDYYSNHFIVIKLSQNINIEGILSTEKSSLCKNKIYSGKYFKVYSSEFCKLDSTLLNNLFNLCEQFIQRKKTYSLRKYFHLSFSIINDRVYIAIPYFISENLKPPINKSLFEYSIYEEYFEDLELVIGIVEDLNLSINH